MIIYIYTKTETTKLEKNIQNIKEECHCNTDNINNCITEGSNIIITDQEKENTPETITGVVEKISINTATKEELMTLSGIGEAKATAIINYRNEHGIFNSIEEIKNISGISESIYEKIKDFIKL